MSLPLHSELEGLTWNGLSEATRNQILAAFGYTAPSLEPVPEFSVEQRSWLDLAFLDVTGYENDIQEINEITKEVGNSVGFRQAIDGRFVTSAYALTDPSVYLPFYGILHNCPFASNIAFPQPQLP